MDTTHTNNVMPSLTNPFDTQGNDQSPSTDYQAAVARGAELQALPKLRHPAETSSVSTAKTG